NGVSSPVLDAATRAAAAAAADPRFPKYAQTVAVLEEGSAAFAARACASAADTNPSLVWAAVSADAERIVNEPSNPRIAQPLWLIDEKGGSYAPTEFPPWALGPFDPYDASERINAGPRGVWLLWYRRVLTADDGGQPADVFGASAQIEIAIKDD